MEEAQKQLEEAKRDGAAESQREALKQLEQAKAELERVLRQLREEEMERTLTMLAARFRKMLDAQTRIYEGTKRVDRVPEAERDHDQEIESARLSREESLIVREADRALVLLREEGSSVAFPETVGLMRDDMQQVTERLADVKVGTSPRSSNKTSSRRSKKRSPRSTRRSRTWKRKRRRPASLRPPASRAIRPWSTNWPS